MIPCSVCERPLLQAGPCPFCNRGSGIPGVVLAGVSALVLAACYGAPPGDWVVCDTSAQADEVCDDGVDNDCDELIDMDDDDCQTP